MGSPSFFDLKVEWEERARRGLLGGAPLPPSSNGGAPAGGGDEKTMELVELDRCVPFSTKDTNVGDAWWCPLPLVSQVVILGAHHIMCHPQSEFACYERQ